MLKSQRFFIALLLLLITTLASISNTHAKGYKGFKLVNPDKCIPVDEELVIKLPQEWHKYADFMKICKLEDKNKSDAKVSIISVWVLDYFNTKFPPPARHIWENFPLPLIVDNNLNQIGQLPEQYPDDPPRELDVSYGKQFQGIPTEIRVDVYNPAVGGDYFYAPLKWNRKTGRYEMKEKEPRDGTGRKD
jgi:hypothetical protein